jgi:hypothetical protein
LRFSSRSTIVASRYQSKRKNWIPAFRAHTVCCSIAQALSSCQPERGSRSV